MKRLLIIFALVGVVGTAAAFRGGALPGPAVGVSALYCALTGCTMTGQQVFSGVTADISTGTNEDLTVSPNGTGQFVVSSAGGAAGQTMYVTNTSAFPARLDMWSTFATDNASRLWLYGNGNGEATVRYATGTPSAQTNTGYSGYFASGTTDADIASKIVTVGVGIPVMVGRHGAGAAGTDVFQVYANVSGTGVKVLNVDGVGNVKIDAGATRTRGTCTLNGASPSVCTATVVAGSLCTCSLVGATAAIAAKGCAVGVASTTLTITSANAATDVANYHCF